ncbi:DUF1715 domain-containing protein [Diplogelasinospora grovesii]|uniref:DUF1715 domain-containing protein n=1 Tax=Diplogelasinospora grovesii TaxID=303347 RepID=A0AAN6NAM0_9PEZI|nr:DUF1715 domain-containing protein [Diplogelasinospora grovesii]
MADDPFEDLLNLEDQFYQEGYQQGYDDGVKAGRIEGRTFGLEKGFAKFLESGRLYGRSVVWANRLPSSSTTTAQSASTDSETGSNTVKEEKQQLPSLSRNPRLEKHITALHDLMEPDTLSVMNTDEAVEDFDDRLKRAQGKAKIIERMVGEAASAPARAGAQGANQQGQEAAAAASS